MQLTENFSLDELTASGIAASRDIDNVPDAAQIAALTGLCVNVLEPTRAYFEALEEGSGGTVRILSGFRVPQINAAVGDPPSSQHCLGEAADIVVGAEPPLAVCRWIAANLDFDQLILERGGGAAQWVHVSWRASGRRGETFTATVVDGTVTLVPGLPE